MVCTLRIDPFFEREDIIRPSKRLFCHGLSGRFIEHLLLFIRSLLCRRELLAQLRQFLASRGKLAKSAQHPLCLLVPVPRSQSYCLIARELRTKDRQGLRGSFVLFRVTGGTSTQPLDSHDLLIKRRYLLLNSPLPLSKLISVDRGWRVRWLDTFIGFRCPRIRRGSERQFFETLLQISQSFSGAINCVLRLLST